MEGFGNDIISAMLSAITNGENDNKIPMDTIVDLEDQKRFLISNIQTLTVADRKSIGNILMLNNKAQLLLPCANGIIINLDVLSPAIIEQMYGLMVHKLGKKSL